MTGSTRARVATVATYGAIATAVVGLGTSLAAAIDDLGPAPTFCSRACEVVRQSEWARPLGIPMSLLGVVFFATMLALAVIEKPLVRKVLAVSGALWGIGLVLLQAFVIGAWCKLCLVADPAAILGAVFVLAGARTVQLRWSGAALAAFGLGGVVVGIALWTEAPSIARTAEGPMPGFVERAQVPGKVTIVEIVDFECPHCRRMQVKLDEALGKTKVPVQIVRKMMPLAMHQYAIPAAVAWCCADAQGKGDEMAHALFAQPTKDLHFDDCKKLAEKIGCDMTKFMAGVDAAKQRVLADIDEVKSAGIEALPTLFIGSKRITGAAMSPEQLVAEIERAKR